MLDAAMAQPPPGPEHTDAAHQPPPASPSDLIRRAHVDGCGAHLAGVVARRAGGHRGRTRYRPVRAGVAPVAAWPYVVLGCGYALSRSGCGSSARSASASWKMRCKRAATYRCGSVP